MCGFGGDWKWLYFTQVCRVRIEGVGVCWDIRYSVRSGWGCGMYLPLPYPTLPCTPLPFRVPFWSRANRKRRAYKATMGAKIPTQSTQGTYEIHAKGCQSRTAGRAGGRGREGGGGLALWKRRTGVWRSRWRWWRGMCACLCLCVFVCVCYSLL